MTRDERQAMCIEKWRISKGKGTLECATGFGFKIFNNFA